MVIERTVGAALRRDCGEAVSWDRDYKELESTLKEATLE